VRKFTVWKTFLMVMVVVTALVFIVTLAFFLSPDVVTTVTHPATATYATYEHSRDLTWGIGLFAFFLLGATIILAILVSEGEEQRRHW
jgi:hypothetical protein